MAPRRGPGKIALKGRILVFPQDNFFLLVQKGVVG